MPPVKLGQGVVFRPGTAHDERWAPNQFLSGFITSIAGDDASIVVFPDVYAPFYEMRVKRDDSLSQDRTWTPSVGEDQEMPEAPSDGQIYGRRNQAWTPISGEDQGYLQSIIVSDTQPAGGLVGMAWLDSTINNFYIFEQGCWIEPAHVNPVVAVSVNITPPVISGNVAIGGVLTSTTGDWSSMPISYAYQWRRGLSPVVGASNPTYVISAEDLEFEITCAVTAINQVGQSQPALSNALMIASPKNLELPVISGNVLVGAVFSTTDGVWKNNPAIVQMTYQWMLDGTPISGAIFNTYTILAGDVSFTLSCVVTATNLIGSTPVTSNSVSIDVPAVVDLPVITSPLLFVDIEDPVVCTTGLWDSLATFTYQWERAGAAISGETNSSYQSVPADANLSLTCDVTATNGLGAATATSNSLVLLRAALPNPLTVDNATVSGYHVQHNNTLHGGARSLPQASKTTGKWMFDVHIDVITATDTAFGLLQDGVSYNFMKLGVSIEKNGQIYANNAFTGKSVGILFSNNNLSFVVDLDNKLLWVRSVTSDSIYGYWNGDSLAIAGSVGGINISGLTTPMAPAVIFGLSGGSATEGCLFNTGTVTLLNAAPAGFIPGWSM